VGVGGGGSGEKRGLGLCGPHSGWVRGGGCRSKNKPKTLIYKDGSNTHILKYMCVTFRYNVSKSPP